MVDIIEFYSSNDALYLFDVVGINNSVLTDLNLVEVLSPILEQYGLISYQAVRVGKDGSSFYIACYYSKHALIKAQKGLPAALEWHGMKCRVKRYSAEPEEKEKRALLYRQCVDLMNYYVGFNNWSLEVKSKKLEISCSTVSANCTVCLHIPRFSISTEGSAEHTISDGSRGTKPGFALKMAYVKACSQACTTLVLAVPESGKCCVVLVDCAEDVKLDIQVTEVEDDLDAELQFDEFIDMLLEYQSEDMVLPPSQQTNESS